MSLNHARRAHMCASRSGCGFYAFGVYLSVCVSAGLTSNARALVVERIAAVVGDQAILLSEVRRRVAPFYTQVVQATDMKERNAQVEKLYRDVLDRLIDEALIQQAARRMLITVPVTEENKAIENVQKQAGLSDPDFWKAVREQGFTETEYRQDVRKQLLRYKVLNQRMRGRVNISEQDIRERYDDLARKQKLVQSYLISHIAFLFENGGTDADLESTRNKALQVYQKIGPTTSASQFEALGGTDLGWVKEGELSAKMDEALRELTVGRATEPIRSSDGFHIFYLRQRQTGAGSMPPFEEAKPNIYRQMMDEAMAKQEKTLLTELRREAVIQKRI